MSILSGTYESELEVQVLIEHAERMYIFYGQCELAFDNKWSAEACITRHLSDQITADVNARIIEQIQQEMFNKMAISTSIFKS